MFETQPSSSPAPQRSAAAIAGSVVPRSVLTPARVVLAAAASSRPDVFEAVAALARQRRGPSSSHIAERLARRHARDSTAIGHGCAVPHAQISCIERPLAVYLRLSQPVDFDAPDGRPVSHVVALVVPRPAISADDQLLEALKKRLAAAWFRAQLDACRGADDVCRLFGAWPPG